MIAGARGALGSPGTIAVRRLSRAFGDRAAVHPFELDIGPGGITGLLGPNGSGKSTLLRMLVGLVRPDGGQAVIDGVPLEGDGTAVRRRCAYSPGEIHLYGELYAGEHLAWLLRGRGEASVRRARAIADELGLPLKERVFGFSHGMKRQLLFAAAMAPDVRVRILDEATEGLDPSKRSRMLDLLREDAARGTTVLLSSHHFGEVERACGELVFLSRGKLLHRANAAEVRARAARLLKLSWPPEADVQAIERGLSSMAPAHVLRRDRSFTVELDTGDPRAFLGRLASAPGLSPPATIEYGHSSLQDLYTDLYGEDGC